MKKYFFISCLLLLSCKEQPEAVDENEKIIDNNASLAEFQNLVQDGDIVFKLGYGQVSRIIQEKLGEKIPISHCGIVHHKTSPYIIHTISGTIAKDDGVQTISLEDFHKDSKPNSLFILRSKDTTSRKMISLKAEEYLEKRIPFDHDFDRFDNNKMYCSELVEEVLKTTLGRGYFGLKQIGNNQLYSFNEFLFNKDFIVVSPENFHK